MLKKNKQITAQNIHEEVILNLPITEYYALFEIMLSNIIKFIEKAERVEKQISKVCESDNNNNDEFKIS